MEGRTQTVTRGKRGRVSSSLEGNRHSGDQVTGSGRILAWMSLEVIGRGEHPLRPPCPSPSHFLYVPRVRDTGWNRGREVPPPVTTAASTFSPMDFQPIDIDTPRLLLLLLRQTLFRSLIARLPANFPRVGAFLERVDECFFLFFFFPCNFMLRTRMIRFGVSRLDLWSKFLWKLYKKFDSTRVVSLLVKDIVYREILFYNHKNSRIETCLPWIPEKIDIARDKIKREKSN